MEKKEKSVATKKQLPAALNGTITIVCKTDMEGYSIISNDINRISSLQERIQKLFNEFMIVDNAPLEVDRIEVSFLSMTHVWRNKII